MMNKIYSVGIPYTMYCCGLRPVYFRWAEGVRLVVRISILFKCVLQICDFWSFLLKLVVRTRDFHQQVGIACLYASTARRITYICIYFIIYNIYYIIIVTSHYKRRLTLLTDLKLQISAAPTAPSICIALGPTTGVWIPVICFDT